MTKKALMKIALLKGVRLECWQRVHAYAIVSKIQDDWHSRAAGDGYKHLYVIFSRQNGKVLSPFYELMPDAILKRGENIEDYVTEKFTNIKDILNS